MVCVHSFQSQRHWELEFDPIAILPSPPDCSESTRLDRIGYSLAIDREDGVGNCPARNAEMKCVVPGLRSGYLDLDFVVEGIFGFLFQAAAGRAISPVHARRSEQIHVHTIL